MKDINDNKTPDMLDQSSKKRGRPATGEALSAADRKRLQRHKMINVDTDNYETWTKSQCLAILSSPRLDNMPYRRLYALKRLVVINGFTATFDDIA